MSLPLDGDVHVCISKKFSCIGHVLLQNNQVGLGSTGVIAKVGPYDESLFDHDLRLEQVEVPACSGLVVCACSLNRDRHVYRSSVEVPYLILEERI